LAERFAVDLVQLTIDQLPHASTDDAWAVGVDGVAFWSELLGGGLGDAADGELRGGVGRKDGEALHSGDGRCVDDLAFDAELIELAHGGLDAKEDRVHVDGENLFKLLLGDFQDRLDLRDAGVIDQHVESTKFLGGGVHGLVEGFLAGDVDRYEHGLAAQCLDFLDDFLGLLLLRLQVSDREVEPVLRKFQRDAPSDALCGASDEGNLGLVLSHSETTFSSKLTDCLYLGQRRTHRGYSGVGVLL